jgi:autotransporter-associated beta strand protein
VTLSASNDYNETTELREGTLEVGPGSLGHGPLQLFDGRLESFADVTLPMRVEVGLPNRRTSPVIGGSHNIAFSGDIAISANNTALTVDPDRAEVRFTGAVSGQGQLIKTGSGTLALTGNNDNTYEGTTIIQEGLVRMGKDNALGKGTLVLSGGSLSNFMADDGFSGLKLPNNFIANGGTIGVIGRSVTFTGNGWLFAEKTLPVYTDSRAIVEFAGALVGLGSLLKTGDGRLILGGFLTNTYAGTTTVNEGTLGLDKVLDATAIAGPLTIGDGIGAARSAVVSLTAADQVADTAPVRIDVDGLFKKNNNSEKINVLTGIGRVTGGDPPTLTVAFDDITATFGGVIKGPGFVVKEVSHGTLTLGPIAGLTIIGNGTTSVSLYGSQVALNAALAGLVYQPLHNYSGLDVLAITAGDGLDTSLASVEIKVKSLAEQAADLEAQVEALRVAGVLNRGQANSLMTKLDLKNNNGDIGRVQAFLNEVNAYVRAGILTTEQANRLLGAGSMLLTGLKRR